MNKNYQIRKIQEKDNSILAEIIRKTLEEYDSAKPGTIYFDPTLDNLSHWFSEDKSIYFVVEKEGKILGGAGIKKLDGIEDDAICELQRMFLKPESRGLGIGKELMSHCLEFAKKQGFQKCYLETLPVLKEAIFLYEKVGFQVLEKPLGDTGHFGCDVAMILNL